jgi:hypothetical protein
MAFALAQALQVSSRVHFRGTFAPLACRKHTWTKWIKIVAAVDPRSIPEHSGV